MAVLEISQLKKTFGTQLVLEDVTFSVEKGSVYGFIGKNGAGKTTTMTIALGLLKADEGDVRINGEVVQYGDTKTNQHIGYLPDVPEFYSFLTAREYMELCVEISGLEKKRGRKKVLELLEMVGLEDNKKRIKHYSRGMKQRLGIAQALINEPLLLICDEPTSALDPIGRQQLLSVLQKVKEQTTVIFSTHILSDVEAICDEVAILNDGRIVKQGTVKQLKAEMSSEKWSVLFESEEDADMLYESLITDKTLKAVVRTTSSVEGSAADAKAAMAALLDNMNRLKVVPVKVERKEATMEEVFLEAIR
ncbi:ABC transporter ATP-binding protein [Alkalibacterium olivapovliticus]|uniref:ABC-2 type transport system ATP-binding protein n=1 Tax=Alkalibacterium olivapovliticus TaxID=99907 RepID=A0A2T0WAA2_9LACT|nr:ABC transporter ATP-binding protein [Alkalibacterium olivapovliticus]PRY83633.1 ABC-2 type transport system ATP-binding protein [Alkalibacterium olivapovliticus]